MISLRLFMRTLSKIGLICFILASSNAFALQCASVLEFNQIISRVGHSPSFHNISVTRGSYESALTSLQISESQIQNWRTNKASILSLGEGASEFIPRLVAMGMQRAVGVDLWYHPEVQFPNNEEGQNLKAYYEKNKSHLLQADARHLPLATESVDLIVSKKLMNNLHIADIADIIIESVRVLKLGGEMKHAHLSPSKWAKLALYLRLNYPEQWHHFSYDPSHLLLIYQKVSPLVPPQAPVLQFDRHRSYGPGLDGVKGEN